MATPQDNFVCRYYAEKVCRSCALIELPYELQLKMKADRLTTLLGEVGLESRLLPFVVPDSSFENRAKAKLAVAGSAQSPLLGFPDSQGNIRDVTSCPLHYPQLNSLALFLKDFIAKFNLVPYQISTRQGELKYLLLRRSAATGEIALRFVLRSLALIPPLQLLVEELEKERPEVKVITANIQPFPKAVIEGEEEHFLTQERRIREKLGDLTFVCSPRSFFQVTPSVAAKLYLTAAEWLSRNGTASLLDLYCGGGGFSLFCGKYFKKVLGVESSPHAIEDAHESARLNGFSNLTFRSIEVDQVLSSLGKEWESIVVNPPRRGLSMPVMEFLISSGATYVCYSSCDPRTLARDLAFLSSSFKMVKVQPFDMFPHTEHFETLVLLERI